MEFWSAIVVMSALGSLGWIVSTIVETVTKARTKRHEAQLDLERDYLRRMLLELEEIKAELARQRDAAARP
jgi:hypothetical protein